RPSASAGMTAKTSAATMAVHDPRRRSATIVTSDGGNDGVIATATDRAPHRDRGLQRQDEGSGQQTGCRKVRTDHVAEDVPESDVDDETRRQRAHGAPRTVQAEERKRIRQSNGEKQVADIA